MKWLEEKTKEQIYNQLLKELKYWFPEVPDSSDRLDPVLRLLLGSFAHQIEKLNQKINSTWDQTFKSLVRNVFVEGLRFPIPAATIMKVDPTDEILELEESVQFLFTDEKEQRNFIFSPLGKSKIMKTDLVLAYYQAGQSCFQIFPRVNKEEKIDRTTSLLKTLNLSSQLSDEHTLYLGIKYNGSSKDFNGVPILFQANENSIHQIRWGKWFLSSRDGYFLEENSFCPGVHLPNKSEIFNSQKEDIIFSEKPYQSPIIIKNLLDYFFYLPSLPLTSWEKCKSPHDLEEQTINSEELFWIKMKLPQKGKKSSFASFDGIHLNCLVAVNKKNLTFFKYTAGNQLLEIELPEESSTILSIDSVVDSNNKKYENRLKIPFSKTPFNYLTEERNGHMILWFDFTEYPDSIPNSISISYSTTFGALGNGIEKGKIQNLWERHPGIRGVSNIFPTTGGMPAKTQEELLSEISSLLRNRGRAVSFEEVENWAKLFDTRIISTRCKNVIRKGLQGAYRGTQVDIQVKSEEFYSEDELKLLKKRLEDFLKARSLINTSIEVNIVSR